uniref:Glycosyltransferase family 2 protein n=1 Tax=Erysipelothrix tonsillarum TaxID=38402 RepID=A0A6S6I689_9FIRM|nr:glycosyltransferase family 2 protein [Erysipelothrix tonsillarum]
MISVIIPMYNEEKVILSCLDSVVSELSKEDELIVIDDGSTDNSRKLVVEYFNSNSIENGKYYFQENSGLGSACNLGILKSSKEYILFIDADDLMFENSLAILKKIIKNTECDLVAFDIENHLINGERSISHYDLKNNAVVDRSAFNKLINGIPSAKNKLIKRSVFEDYHIEFPTNLWFEDLMTTTKFFANDIKVYYTKDIKYQYIHRDNSIIRNKNLKKNLDVIEVVESIIKYYDEKNQLESRKDALHNLIIKHLIVHAPVRIIKNSDFNYQESQVLIDELTKTYREIISNYPVFKNSKYDLGRKDKLVKSLVLSNKIRLLTFILKNT